MRSALRRRVERLESQINKADDSAWANKAMSLWAIREKGLPFETDADRDFATALTQEEHMRAITIAAGHYDLEAIIRCAEEIGRRTPGACL